MNANSLFNAAMRIKNGRNPQVVLKEHIDAWNRSFSSDLYMQEPSLTGDLRVDAYLAGAAHFEASAIGLECPQWANATCRFLPEPFFIGGKNAILLALVETPLTFRIRNVFVGATTLRTLDWNRN